MKLVYHSSDDIESSFDRTIIEIVRDSSISIACPYLSLDYLRRIIRLSTSWRLITDLPELLAATRTSQRHEVADFLLSHENQARHHSGLHAKVVLGDSSGLISSSNLTKSGICVRTEMGVVVTKTELLHELNEWYESIWDNAIKPNEQTFETLLSKLPEVTAIKQPAELTQTARSASALVTLIEDQDIRHYRNARGYYTGYRQTFCVIAGSIASLNVSNSFREMSTGNYFRKRQNLIEKGVLKLEDPYFGYTFMEDFVFDAPSPAASIVDGNPRSGPKCWGKK